jgi:NADP-dependent 3-hydroxy acid dehydrogenase YdfG
MNKVAVVTGASSGIGKALTEMLLSDGHSVLAGGRTIGSVMAESERLRLSSLDLLEDSTPAALLDAALSAFGRVDYLFVNAGTIESGTIEDIDLDRLCAMIRLKVESSVRLIYTFLKHFKKQGSGHIFITSSVLGTKTRENSGAYAACNHALEALAEALRMELSDTDIQITCIEPGLVSTGLHRDWPVHPKELLNIANTLTPNDIAEAVRDILRKPSHVRVPKYMILPKGHRI